MTTATTVTTAHANKKLLEIKLCNKLKSLSKKAAMAFAQDDTKPRYKKYEQGDIPDGAICLYNQSHSTANSTESTVKVLPELSMKHINIVVDHDNRDVNKAPVIEFILLQLKLANTGLHVFPNTLRITRALPGETISTTIPCKFQQNKSHSKYLTFAANELYTADISTPDPLTLQIGIDRSIQTALIRVFPTGQAASLANERLIIFNGAVRIVNHISESPPPVSAGSSDWSTFAGKDFEVTEAQNILTYLDGEYPDLQFASIERGDPNKVPIQKNQIIVDEYRSFASKFARNVFLLDYVYASICSVAAALVLARTTTAPPWHKTLLSLNEHIKSRNVHKSSFKSLKNNIAIAAAIVTSVEQDIKLSEYLNTLHTGATGNTTGFRLLKYFIAKTPPQRISTPKRPVEGEVHRLEITPATENAVVRSWNDTHTETSLKAISRMFRRFFIEDFDGLLIPTQYDARKQHPDYAKPLKKGAISVCIDTTRQLELRVQLPYQELYKSAAAKSSTYIDGSSSSYAGSSLPSYSSQSSGLDPSSSHSSVPRSRQSSKPLSPSDISDMKMEDVGDGGL